MKRPTGAELRIRRNSEQNAGIVHTETPQQKTLPGRGRSPQKKRGSLQKTLNAESHSDPLDRGCVSRRRNSHAKFAKKLKTDAQHSTRTM